jgi:thiamine biosynthesis lipoprotein ApbE
MTADALATACMVMDAEDALEMLESQPGVEALIVTAGQQSGKWELRRTPGFPEVL